MMLNITLKMIVRSWWRNKVFFIISVASLALGLACTNLLMVYFIHEYGVERQNPVREQIYFLQQDDPMNEGEQVIFATADIPARLKGNYAEVEECLQLGVPGMTYCMIDGQKAEGDWTLISADSTMTHFFDYRTSEGNLKQALREPGKMVVSASCARKLFGDRPAVGQQVEVHLTYGDVRTYEVAAVLQKREQSLLRFDMLTTNDPDFFWGGVTLLKLTPGTDARSLTEKINRDKIPTLTDNRTKYTVVPMEAICFTATGKSPQQTLRFINQTPVQTLYISLLAAVLILFIACCNYTNMSLSRLLQQLRTIHVEKLMGGTLCNIRFQLFADAFLTVLLAFGLSLLLVNDCLTIFNNLLNARLTMGFFLSSQILPWLLVFVSIISVVPAWYISRKLSNLSISEYRYRYSGKQKQRFVALLVTVQFAISIGLLLATTAARNQMRLTEKQAEHYAGCIEIGDPFGAPLAPLKTELEKRVQGIESITLSESSVLNAWIRDLTVQHPSGGETHTNLLTLKGDSTLLHTLNIQQLDGEIPARLLDHYAQPVLVNETFARLLIPADTDPIGHPLREFDPQNKDSLAVVAGIVHDFPVNSLENTMTPLAIHLLPGSALQKAFYLQIRLQPEKHTEALQRIEELWKSMNPGQPFRYTDMHLEFLKRNEKVLSTAHILTFYALIALLLTGSGLFGITWYATRQRVREISIRKIHGATRLQIIWLLNRPFCLYAMVAYVVATPISWWLMQQWLEQFAYHAPLSAGIFVWPLWIVWNISFLIVYLQGWILNQVKPIEAMKQE